MGAAGFYRARKEDVSNNCDHPSCESLSETQNEKEARIQDKDESKIVKASKPVRPVKKELSCSEGTGDGEVVGIAEGSSGVRASAASSAGTAPAFTLHKCICP